jgi:hypothetical protein
LGLSALGCALLIAASAPGRRHDYFFTVTGYVAAEDGAPLQDVEVILEVDTPIYEGLKPVKTERLVTSKGAFFFACISHTRTTKYTVTVRKDGFEPQRVTGSAPPDGQFRIRLKRARVNNTSSAPGTNH